MRGSSRILITRPSIWVGHRLRYTFGILIASPSIQKFDNSPLNRGCPWSEEQNLIGPPVWAGHGVRCTSCPLVAHVGLCSVRVLHGTPGSRVGPSLPIWLACYRAR